MGIRMLNRRRSDPPAPTHAVGASTARIPTGPVTAVRHTVADARRRLAEREFRKPVARRPRDTAVWRLGADLARNSLAFCRSLLPKPARPAHTLTVFVATLPERPAVKPPDGSGPTPCRLPNR
ncbi:MULTISPECIES: hypothetical protein [Streptomyces]|uniref:Uncharacterized protein n=1 Tax=Streptomyces cadmiisoli TaxID=2184053 RepID=A0A2Z4J532_9ACTN|nr:MULTISPECIES: hypothetical protein [Streptomyces]AWW40117.1 hypothetical protein DN051_28470 [Streptomyces cadmiisoli]KOV70223.1 hypothetical protein ADL00_09880 [Streptomyces sp. AS58]